ncbi:MAG: tetratricopeptide repeat protein [Candidatus Omnitrophica bacterium]|nr:tetratricopeptide repeat protein [Candidatus Omnitrophota bacterium]
MGPIKEDFKYQHMRAITAIFFMAVLLGVSPKVFADDSASTMPPQQTAGNGTDQAQAEREEFVKEIRRVESLNKKYTQEIQDIRGLLADKDADYQKRMQELEAKMAAEQNESAKKAVAQEQIHQTTLELENKTNEMLAKSADVDPANQKFREELAKAHYNMGNIYFERGEYQRAVVEYYQAVDLVPNDPDTHYNLAFVSGEYLGDQETALKHYQWYLYLKPDASDVAAVKEKIMTAKFSLRSKVDSPLDKNDNNFNLTR